MVKQDKGEAESSYAELKALLKTKSEAERQLNEISVAMKSLHKQNYTRNEASVEMDALQTKEVEIGKVWTATNNAILHHTPQSYREAALKILHLTNNLNVENDNERAILAIKDSALVLYRLENEGEDPINF